MESKSDVTGTKSRPTGPAPAARPQSDQLPAEIGGVHLRSAATAGDAAAAYEVAVRFAEGRGVPANPQVAAHWYERAAAKGLAPAQFRYASLLEKGLGVKKDLAQARKLYLAAAEQGNAKAMHNLAVLYAEGIDGKPDYASAAHWFRKAADAGISDSQYNLGVLYARGLGVETEPGPSPTNGSRSRPPKATRKPPKSATKWRPIWTPTLWRPPSKRLRVSSPSGRPRTRSMFPRRPAAGITRRKRPRQAQAAPGRPAAPGRADVTGLLHRRKTVNKRDLLPKDVSPRAFIANIATVDGSRVAAGSASPRA